MARTRRSNAVPVLNENETVSHEIRKIKNGYILRESKSGPKSYKSEETYYPTKPKMPIEVPKSAPITRARATKKRSK